jgi:ADP-ribose pyrophosphatase YjhB (NUDIX family)
MDMMKLWQQRQVPSRLVSGNVARMLQRQRQQQQALTKSSQLQCCHAGQRAYTITSALHCSRKSSLRLDLNLKRRHSLGGLTAACSLLLLCSSASYDPNNNDGTQHSIRSSRTLSSLASITKCHEEEEGENTSTTAATTQLKLPPFDEKVLSYDHYNGVTLYLGEYLQWQQQHQQQNNQQQQQQQQDESLLSDDTLSFSQQLERAVQFWKAEGRKGVWIHVPPTASHWVPDCIRAGFDFHKVLREEEEHTTDAANGDTTTTSASTSTISSNPPPPPPPTLVMSQWLPNTPSKLPLGPSHQVGVGAVVLHPNDPSQMLCVKELSGPAAAFDLWKMPTGLLDHAEDIPEAASRELEEETGLQGTLHGIICFRQAHRPGSNSDLFFVCHMKLQDESNITLRPQADEIAEIRWMSVHDFCDQDRWQGSPLYTTLNNCILQVSQAAVVAAKEHNVDLSEARNRHLLPMIEHEQLAVGFGIEGMTNALFLPPSTTRDSASSSSSSSKL